MSAMTAHQAPGEIRAGRDRDAGRGARAAVSRQRRLFLSITLGFPVAFYFLLLALLMMRFGHLPNYVTPYDWFGNVSRIIASTGSVSDMLSIVANEWLLEVGSMNYSYGHGVSEWSLSIIPHKVALLTVVGALVALNFALIAEQKPTGTLWGQCAQSVRAGLMTSIGAVGASLMSITLSWVVCHSGPSWVVSLAILGVEVSTSLAIEPIGPAISLAGFALLVLSALLTVRNNRTAAPVLPMRQDREAAPC